jgi:MGT family glycosyltransferase
VYTPSGELTLDIVANFGLAPYRVMREITAGAVEADIACLEKFEPDVVVGDMRWTLNISTDVARVPYVSIMNGFWTRHRSVPMAAVDSHWATRWLPAPVSRTLFKHLEQPAARLVGRAYREMRRRYGLDASAARDLFGLMEGELNLVADTPDFAPTSGLPSSYHYVGPILWNAGWAAGDEPSWFRELDPTRPLVYVTGGSSGHDNLFRIAAEALRDSPYQVVMTTAGRGESIPPADNIHVVDFAPGIRLMERADVVLCHGGNGTINQAIAGCTPIVGIARHVEQALHIDRVVALGLGRRVYASRGIARKIRSAVDEVVGEPRYTQTARAFQATSKQFDGSRLAASHIHRFLGEASP